MPLEWDPAAHQCLVNGPTAQAEADQLELGRRVAEELHHQPAAIEDWPA
jgi:hypothetical protein